MPAGITFGTDIPLHPLLTTKKCMTCGAEKDHGEYYKAPKNVSGLQNECKPCYKIRSQQRYLRNRDLRSRQCKEWYENNAERKDAKSKEWRARNKDRISTYNLGSRLREPEKYRARQELIMAVRKKLVSKPDCCTDCGNSMPSKKLHGHHHDYSKPLDVTWLCYKCHADRHRNDRGRRRQPITNGATA
jgi:hypothetical protein